MLNQINVMGRLTRDPELRHTANNTPVCSFSIACDRDFKTESGERETDFLDVIAWRSTAEFVSKYFTKGRMAVVSGRLQMRDWTDKEGNKRRSAEIVADNVYFGDSKPAEEGSPAKNGAPNGGFAQNAQPNGYGFGQGAPTGGYGFGQGNPTGGYGFPGNFDPGI